MASNTGKRKYSTSETTATAPAKRKLQSVLGNGVPLVEITDGAGKVGGIQESGALLSDSRRVRTTEDYGCSARADGDGSLKEPVCFRVSGIPPNWCRDTLEKALQNIDPELDFKDAELSQLFPASFDTSQTALLNLNRYTAYFRYFERKEEKNIVIREDGRKVRLVIDRHFYDLTPMNRPESPITVDVVAVTGLAHHAFGSWRSRSQKDRSIDHPMWLRDFLPEKFPNTRIMTYGYDGGLVNPNQARITDYQRNFTECLYNARRGCPKRPIIFIGHSIGGLLIVQTLIEWSQYSKYHSIRDCIRGIFFFGTPHQGLRTVALSEMVGEMADDNKVRTLLAQLEEGSEYLENQKDALSRVWNNFNGGVFTFYETEKANSVKKAGAGVLSKMGDPVQMVQRLSAQLYLPNEHRFPIQSNHTDMVKFDSPQDRTFQTIVTCMEECMKKYTNKRVIESIGKLVRREEDDYFVDQSHYIKAFSEFYDLENDGGFFWAFRNLEYKNWAENHKKVQVLVFRGVPA